jgi:PhnB protein
MPVKAIPEGDHSITPYLIVAGAAKALEFYQQAFGATELFRMSMPDGRVGHAEMQIGDSRMMLADGCPEMGFHDPKAIGGTAVSLLIYCEDVDALFARAVAAGATLLRPVQDQFYGDRSGTLTDPFGHVWTIATHKEDLSPEEIARRSEECLKPQAGQNA